MGENDRQSIVDKGGKAHNRDIHSNHEAYMAARQKGTEEKCTRGFTHSEGVGGGGEIYIS